MEVCTERLMRRIEGFARFNDTPGEGVTRFSYGGSDRKAREYFCEICAGLGLEPRTDSIGNIRARYEGQEGGLAPVMLGSHIDTVRNGGRYDGVVGVVGALEVLSVMRAEHYRPRRPLEVVVFAEEEGSNFGATLIGSKALVGKFYPAQLKDLRNPGGTACYDMLRGCGLDPERLREGILKPGDVSAMVELHIEQGIVLEKLGYRIGVVQCIAGMSTILVTVEGASNHAGATPMNMRRDPMCAAARLICAVEEIAKTKALPDTVATVGQIHCSPNMPNVIAKQVAFTVDIRDIKQSGIDRVLGLIRGNAAEIAGREDVRISIELLGTTPCIGLSPDVTRLIEAAAEALEVPYYRINSGAVHDAAMMTEITDVGMIFIPSVEGKSHNPEEYTSPEDIALGCAVLLETAIRLSNRD